MSDFKELRNQCVKSLYMCAKNVTRYLENDARDEQLSKLKQILKNYCILEAQENLEAGVINSVKDSIDPSNLDSIENIVFSQLSQGTELDYNSHQYMMEFERIINECNRISPEQIDEDVAITETTQTYIDPLTKKPIRDPVRNTNCGHIYDREVILNHIRHKKGAMCPVVGCMMQIPLQIDHLVSDDALSTHLLQDEEMLFSPEY